MVTIFPLQVQKFGLKKVLLQRSSLAFFLTTLAVPIFAVLCLRPTPAQAGALGEAAFAIATERKEDIDAGTESGATSNRRFRFNLAVGWLSELNRDELAGSQHNLGYGMVVRTERGFESSSDLNGFGLGVFLGYYSGPISIRIDYFAFAELKSNDGIVETAFREGNGYAVSARWLHWFEEPRGDRPTRFGIGPALSFEQTVYKKSRSGSLPESGATRMTESLTPGLVGVFNF